jgi:hypothetical protein
MSLAMCIVFLPWLCMSDSGEAAGTNAYCCRGLIGCFGVVRTIEGIIFLLLGYSVLWDGVVEVCVTEMNSVWY